MTLFYIVLIITVQTKVLKKCFYSKASLTNSTIICPDPTDPNSLVFAFSNVKNIYKGETHIIRYNITLPESKNYKITVQIENSVKTGDIELINFFISNIGDNFPCQSQFSLVTNQT